MAGVDVPLSLEPMEAESVDRLPEGSQWQYEPKWDGFRCISFRDGERIELQSRNQKPLGRYFPDLVVALAALSLDRFVLDGEILAFIRGEPTFEPLQLRLHPAASRVAKLAAEQPATFMAFDLLAGETGRSVISRPLRERRAMLEELFEGIDPHLPTIMLSPATTDHSTALARGDRARPGRHCGEATGPALSARRPGNAQVQALEDRRLRGRRGLLQAARRADRFPAAGAL
jgi:ATP-dependent DNA ligase